MKTVWGLTAILAFAPGLARAQDRAELEGTWKYPAIQKLSASGVIAVRTLFLTGEKPPLAWVDNPERRELAAALWRVAPKLDAEKSDSKRENARRELGLALSRLGERDKAARLLTLPQDCQTALYFETVRQLLAGRLERAEQSLSALNEPARSGVRFLLAEAYALWRDDQKKARRLLSAAPLKQNGDVLFLSELERARRLARWGDPASAKRIFARLEKQALQDSQSDAGETLLFLLFDVRLTSPGFFDDAIAMLRRPKSHRWAIPILLQRGHFAEADEILPSLAPSQAFDALLSGAFDETLKPENPIAQYTAQNLLRFWRALPRREKEGRAGELVRALTGLQGVEKTEAFITQELKGKAAREATFQLRGTVFQDEDLQKQIAPAKLQSWRDNALREEIARAWHVERTNEIMRGYNDSVDVEAAWNLVAYAAVDAKNFEAARFALNRAEKFSLDSANPEEGVWSRMNLWRKIGDQAQAKKLEARYRHLTGQPSSGALTEIYRSVGIVGAPNDGEGVQVERAQNFSQILRMPNPTQRALALAAWARFRFPLENVTFDAPR